MSKPASPKNFEAALAELEALITQMESGQLALEESLAAYQRGTELLKFCQGMLADVEQQIRILDEANTLQPFPPNDN